MAKVTILKVDACPAEGKAMKGVEVMDSVQITLPSGVKVWVREDGIGVFKPNGDGIITVQFGLFRIHTLDLHGNNVGG